LGMDVKIQNSIRQLADRIEQLKVKSQKSKFKIASQKLKVFCSTFEF